MKTFTTTTTFLTLLSLTSAATVNLKPTKCLNTEVPLDEFSIAVGSLVKKDLPTVCGLEIVSASEVDVKTIVCRAFKDAEGKDPGSAEFTIDSPALIATNPVRERSLLCEVKADGNSSSNSTATASGVPDVVTRVTFITASLTGGATQGTPSPSSNATVPGVTGGPSVQPTNPSATAPSGSAGPQQTGAASGRAWSAGAVAVGFAVWLL